MRLSRYNKDVQLISLLTWDLKNAGDVTCKATIPSDMEVEAYFLAKENGIVAGIALAEMVFSEVDPSLKVLRRE